MGDHLQYVSMIMYADDTVLFFSHKNKSEIERCLNVDMDMVKTETMLFVTCKRLKNARESLGVICDGVKISFTKTYSALTTFWMQTFTRISTSNPLTKRQAPDCASWNE